MDDTRNDVARAETWDVKRSRSAAYDAVDGIASARELVQWGCGDGDARTSARAETWEHGQRKRAIAAAAGKQETVRTDNTIASRSIRAGAKEGKRQRVG